MFIWKNAAPIRIWKKAGKNEALLFDGRFRREEALSAVPGRNSWGNKRTAKGSFTEDRPLQGSLSDGFEGKKERESGSMKNRTQGKHSARKSFPFLLL